MLIASKHAFTNFLTLHYFWNWKKNRQMEVNSALFWFFRYVCSKTKKEIEASRSLYLDELPSVLILHLKRFIYDETSSGGCQKLLKNIDFPVDLEIPKDILSNSSKNKYHPKQRSYKLFAVVSTFLKLTIFGHILICWISWIIFCMLCIRIGKGF